LQTERTPKQWVKYSYPCHQNSLYTYISNLRKRVSYIKNLITKVKRLKFGKAVEVKKFWIPGFFN